MRYTFPINSINISERLGLTDATNKPERISYITREIIHNSIEYNATDISTLTCLYKNKKYFCIGSNSQPFVNIETLKENLRPSVSGDHSGIQGSGMKLAMFLAASENQQLIVASNNNGSEFAAKLSIYHGNKAVIEDHYDVIPFLQQAYGSYYYKFNNFFLYLVNEERLFEKYTMHLIREVCGNSNLSIHHFRGEDVRIESSSSIDFFINEKHKRYSSYPTIDVINNKFRIDYAKFLIKNIPHPSEKNITFDATIEFGVYPNFKTKEGGRTISNDGTINDLVKVSPYRLFIKYDKGTIEEKTKNDHDNNWSRVYTDPIFISRHNYDLLGEVDFLCPSNIDYIKDGYVTENDLKNYEFIEQKIRNNFSFENVAHWIPVMKTHITIMCNETTKKLNLYKMFATFGSPNQMFMCEDNDLMRKIAKATFVKLNEENPAGLSEFRKNLSKHFPWAVKNNKRLPINLELVGKTYKLIYVYEGAEGLQNKITKVAPGDNFKNVNLRYENGEKVTGRISHVNEGFELKCKYDNVYEFNVLNYTKRIKKENGTVEYHDISEEEFKSARFKQKQDGNHIKILPARECTVICSGIGYKLRLRCELPISTEFKQQRIKSKIRINDEKEKYSEGSDKLYFSEPNMPNEHIRFSDCKLLINDYSKIFQPIVYGDTKLIPKLKDTWNNIYIEMLKHAIEIDDNYNNIIINWNNQKQNIGEIKEGFSSEYTYFLNIAMLGFIKQNPDIQKLIKRIEEIKNYEEQSETTHQKIEETVEKSKKILKTERSKPVAEIGEDFVEQDFLGQLSSTNIDDLLNS